MGQGTIYVLTNPVLKDRVKIGKTGRSPEGRADELSSTGIPYRFVVAYEQQVSDCEAAERQIHQTLQNHRINRRREFFKLTLKEAIHWVADICDEYPPLDEFQPVSDKAALKEKSTGEWPRISVRSYDRAARPKRPRRPSVKGVEYVCVCCVGCERNYSVTVHCLELGTTCPFCHRHQDVSVKW